MIVLERVFKSFPLDDGRSEPVLSDLNLTVSEGEFLAILGPSGCGKTTLLNLIAGFTAPTRGRVLFNGTEIDRPAPERAVVFQDAVLFPWLTVSRNIAFGLKLQGLKGKNLDEKVSRYLAIMGLTEEDGAKYPHALSGGMSQRVSLARVLALKPKALLMDEPFSSLDVDTRERLQEELLRLWAARRTTVIYVTHSVEEAAYLADRVLLLGPSPGRARTVPVPLKRPRNRRSEEFLATKEALRGGFPEPLCCATFRHSPHLEGGFRP
ncbi:MAG: ABC transporter ATP-binding protein [Synergistaceae bacterium]|jgi:NitT/TauT family transport system ATP-binding protein|nr:ABC transporter ATP-binding protein [Synergistaceae bacterium]